MSAVWFSSGETNARLSSLSVCLLLAVFPIWFCPWEMQEGAPGSRVHSTHSKTYFHGKTQCEVSFSCWASMYGTTSFSLASNAPIYLVHFKVSFWLQSLPLATLWGVLFPILAENTRLSVYWMWRGDCLGGGLTVLALVPLAAGDLLASQLSLWDKNNTDRTLCWRPFNRISLCEITTF